VPNLKKIWANGPYGGEKLARWCEEQGGRQIEVLERDRKVRSFEVLLKRWIAQRTFGWVRRDRRLQRFAER